MARPRSVQSEKPVELWEVGLPASPSEAGVLPKKMEGQPLKSTQKIPVEVRPYSSGMYESWDPQEVYVSVHADNHDGVLMDLRKPRVAALPSDEKAHTTLISPYGIEFLSNYEFQEGTLLKIQLALPDYWARKQRFVEYTRVDAPEKLKMLGKVVTSKDLSKRGRKKLTTVQMVNIDEIDEKVLASFLAEQPLVTQRGSSKS